VGLTPEDKRRMDRERARTWLSGRGKNAGSPEQALRLVLNLKADTPVRIGMNGTTRRLESVGGKKAEFLALGVAGILIGEGLLRAAEAVQNGQKKKEKGPQLGPCTLTRPGYQLLICAGHPDGAPATPQAPQPGPNAEQPTAERDAETTGD